MANICYTSKSATPNCVLSVLLKKALGVFFDPCFVLEALKTRFCYQLFWKAIRFVVVSLYSYKASYNATTGYLFNSVAYSEEIEKFTLENNGEN